MTVTPMSFDALRTAAEDPRHVRKAMQLLVFRAPLSVPVPSLATGFVDSADRTKLSVDLTKWTPFGILTADGMERSADVEEEEAEGYNYGDPVRSDMTKAPKQLKITMLKDKDRLSLEHQYGVDLSGVVATNGKGFAFDEPSLPVFPYLRFLAIDLDYWEGDLTKPIYGVDCYPRVKQASLPTISKKKSGYQENEITFKVFADADLGTPCRHWVDGAGYDMSAQGFKTA